jgi:hypothetical protein
VQDKKTARYWSIVTEEAVYGEAKGKKLELLPGATKTTWGIWRRPHACSVSIKYMVFTIVTKCRSGSGNRFTSGGCKSEMLGTSTMFSGKMYNGSIGN